MVSQVWIHLFSLLGEYWDMETLRDIGNTMGEFIKIAKQTKIQRYTSFAQICVYMDLSRELPEAISLNWEDKEWIQPIDYEQLPFRCRHYHDYGHLGRNCPKLRPGAELYAPCLDKDTEMDGFAQVKNKRRSKGGGKPNTRKEQVTKEHRPRNPFEALGSENEDGGFLAEKSVVD